MLRTDPESTDAHRWLGQIFYNLGAFQAAATHLQKLVELEPENYLGLVAQLREAGLAVEMELRQRGVGKSLAWAENMGATHAIIIGQRDLESGQVAIKHLKTGEQTDVGNNCEAILAEIL